MKIYEPNTELTVDDIKRMIDKVQNSDYGYLPGVQSLDYAASTFFTIYEDFPCKTVKPVDDPSFEFCYGVHLPNCKSQDMDQYFRWCFSTFGAAGFEMEAAARKFWFKDEKHRTMFVLKWS